MAQKNYKPHYEHLKNKWIDKHKALQKELLEKHGEAFHWIAHRLKHASLGSLGALILTLQQPVIATTSAQPVATAQEQVYDLDKNIFLVHDLQSITPDEVRELTTKEETKIATLLSERFKFPVSAELSGNRLNRSYGLIGAEQHLARYPGDSMSSHFDPPAGGAQEALAFGGSGMAPGLGAWRYFAPSKELMSEQDSMREKYYIAVQTFLAPGFSERTKELVDFFRFRKMLVVNPQNGKAIVSVIGDAGPAAWTGKHLGGSPEVMSYLQRVDGKAVGPVLYFFIDDPEDKVPLGPISVE